MCDHNDIYVNGDCRACAREYQAKYRRKQRLGVALLKAAEARGLSGYEAIAVLQNADYQTLQECQAKGIKAVRE